MRRKVGLILNLDYETKKQEHNMCKTKSNKILLQRKILKQKQGFDKRTYPNLVLNRLKVTKSFISSCIYWAPNSNKFFNKLLTYMWPMFTHVYPCVSMCEL